MKKVSAVCFDLFETLITEYSQGNRKTSRADLDYQLLIGLSDKQFRQEWNSRQKQRMTGEYTDYRSVMRDIMGKHRLSADESVIEQLYKDRVKEKSVPFEDISPNIIKLLERLKEQGMKLAVISNCTEEEVQSWPASKLAPYFDEVVFSYQTGYAKPDRQIYELTCSRLGVDAAACAFVGDGGSHELDGAKAAGMAAFHAVWFLPESISGAITSYKKLIRPDQLFEVLESCSEC